MKVNFDHFDIFFEIGGFPLNKDAAFFSSMVVAFLSLLSTFEVYRWLGTKGAVLTVGASLAWVALGFYFKKSKSV